MGTNYYTEIEACECCGRRAEDLHIGKSSSGWRFLFQSHRHLGLDSRAAWEAYLLKAEAKAGENIITDENGVDHSVAEFFTMVDRMQAAGHPTRGDDLSMETRDDQGFRIADGREFC